MIVDFHSHTSASDGTLEPAQLAVAMRDRGVEIFSVTDHDSLAAYDQLDGAFQFAKLVVGVEINSTYRGNEVHVLGYGFPADSPPVHQLLEANRREREARAQRMVEQLQRIGLEITPANVRAEAGSAESALGRPHVAKALALARELMKGLFDAGGSVSSVPAFDGGVEAITDSLFTKGFDPSAEFDADKEGRSLATKVGYEHDALLDFLKDLYKTKGDTKDAFPTHPPLSHRIERLEEK